MKNVYRCSISFFFILIFSTFSYSQVTFGVKSGINIATTKDLITFPKNRLGWYGGGLSGQGTKIITVFTDDRPAGRKDLSFYMSVRENGLCGPSDYFSRSGWVVSGGIGGAQIIA